MFALLRAIAMNPKLIICDEVTSALDQLVAEGILKLLRRLQEELQISYLFITHDLSTVRAMADGRYRHAPRKGGAVGIERTGI